MMLADYVFSVTPSRTIYRQEEEFFTFKILKNRTHGTFTINELKFNTITSAPVDGVMWYTVECSRDIAAELRRVAAENFPGQIYEHSSVMVDTFDLGNELYIFAKLKWENT